MKKLLRFVVLSLCLTVVAPLTFTACTRPITIVTPAGQAAFTANESLKRVERLQDAAIAAYRNGSLSREAARDVAFVTVQLAEIADAATQGWQASFRQAWTQAKQELAVLRPGGQFAVIAATIDELLTGGA